MFVSPHSAIVSAVLAGTLGCNSGKVPPVHDISPAIVDLPAQGGSCHAVHDDPVTHQTGKWTVYVFDLASLVDGDESSASASLPFSAWFTT